MPNFQLPYGVADTMPDSFALRSLLEQRFCDLFRSWGYRRIDAPILARYDLFRTGVGAVDPSRLFKFGDTDGELLALRSDMTLPLARIAATKLSQDLPQRLSYVAPSFCLKRELGREREFHQAGVELFGVQGACADAEVIALAIRALDGAGIGAFNIEVGQVGIVRGILDETRMSDEDKWEVVARINNKALISEEEFPALRGRAQTLNALLGMYGDVTVLEKARKILNNAESLSALDNLLEVYALLSAYGLKDFVSFDLGLVNGYSYYSGVVFKGITAFFGAPILGGGRYDHLSEVFGRSIPATGFAIGLEHAMRALEKQGVRAPACGPDVVLLIPTGMESKGYRCAEELRAQGKSVLPWYSDPEAGLRFAAKMGAKAVRVEEERDR